MHKKLRVKKISKKNKEKRIDYGWKHKDHTIANYWQYVWFTDEGHIDPSTTPGQRVLYEESTRLQSENMQEMLDQFGVTVYVEGLFISYISA